MYESILTYHPTHRSVLRVMCTRIGDHFILSEEFTDGISLTNYLDGVIEDILSKVDYRKRDDVRIYQWCGKKEGMFKINYEIGNKVNRSMPPFTVKNISWQYWSAEFKPETFQVLYEKS